MSGRPEGPDPPPLLDWRAPAHWSWDAEPCRYCAGATHLRDSKRKPAHKVCAEQAIQRQAADTAAAYNSRKDTL